MTRQPLDRTTQFPGSPKNNDQFRIEGILHTEAATHIRADELDFLVRHAEHVMRQLRAQTVDALAAEQQMEGAAGGVVVADRTAMLDRGDD